MIIQKLKKALKWTTPYGIVEFSRNFRRDYKYSYPYLRYKDPEIFKTLNKNRILNNTHKNQRCFILGTGPSINKIDINKLKNEHCIFLSQFYLHKDYQHISPKYHLFSGMTPHLNGKATYDHWLKFFKQIEDSVPVKTALFMNYFDKNFILKHGFFSKHNVYYSCFKKDLKKIFKDKINLTQVLYGATGIPIMAIQLAIGMGFKEIYLLGIDCCWDKETHASHFYKTEASVVDHLGLTPDDILANLDRIEDEYRAYLSLLDQFRALNTFGKSQGINIFNATKGGVLEIFNRVNYDSLFK
ncbi:MAG: 6-hydroxymethylpterin diphosphokinase MptE-like protein [bacterium]